MTTHPTRFFHDFADPLSYVTELELRAAEATTGIGVERVPFELRPPPGALLDPADPEWRERLDTAVRVASGTGGRLRAPSLLPWTRKAHELVLHAAGSGKESELVLALYETLLVEGRDLGRVDVLVELADVLGMDKTEAKAVLDVDRYAEKVAEAAESARRAGVRSAPTLLGEAGHLEGFHNREAISTLLRQSTTDAR